MRITWTRPFLHAAVVFLWADSSLAQDQLSFTRQDTLLGAFAGPHGCATGDFNGDGEADLVFAASDIPSLRILLGRGDGFPRLQTRYFATSVLMCSQQG